MNRLLTRKRRRLLEAFVAIDRSRTVASMIDSDRETVDKDIYATKRRMIRFLPVSWRGRDYVTRADLNSIPRSELLNFCKFLDRRVREMGEAATTSRSGWKQKTRLNQTEVIKLSAWFMSKKEAWAGYKPLVQDIIKDIKTDLGFDTNSPQIRGFMDQLGIQYSIMESPAGSKMARLVARGDQQEARITALDTRVQELERQRAAMAEHIKALEQRLDGLMVKLGEK